MTTTSSTSYRRNTYGHIGIVPHLRLNVLGRSTHIPSMAHRGQRTGSKTRQIAVEGFVWRRFIHGGVHHSLDVLDLHFSMALIRDRQTEKRDNRSVGSLNLTVSLTVSGRIESVCDSAFKGKLVNVRDVKHVLLSEIIQSGMPRSSQHFLSRRLHQRCRWFRMDTGEHTSQDCPLPLTNIYWSTWMSRTAPGDRRVRLEMVVFPVVSDAATWASYRKGCVRQWHNAHTDVYVSE